MSNETVKKRRYVRKRALSATDPRLPEVLKRLKEGSPLIKESKALGFKHNGQLRYALRELIGRAEFDRMMTQRVGWRRRRAGEKAEGQEAVGQQDGGQKDGGQKATTPASLSKPSSADGNGC